MREIYSLKYRVRGRIRWQKLTKVKGDGIDKEMGFRFFQLEDDTLIHIPLDSEVRFSPQRALVIERKMSKDAGQPVQRA